MKQKLHNIIAGVLLVILSAALMYSYIGKDGHTTNPFWHIATIPTAIYGLLLATALWKD